MRFRFNKQEFSLYILGLVLALNYPLTVTWDGYLYLGSAVSLFSQEMIPYFHWLREPGYPLFVRIAIELGGFNLIVIAQFFLLVHATSMLEKTCIKLAEAVRKETSSKALLLGRVASILITAGYAASLLQQVFFVWFVSYAVYLCAQGLSKPILIRMFFLGFFSSLISILLALGLAISLAIFAAFVNPKRKFAKGVALLLLGIFAFSVPWNLYKANLDLSSRIYKDNVFFWEKSGLGNEGNVVDRFQRIPGSILSINSITAPRNLDGGVIALENRIYGTPRFKETDLCGRWIYGPQEYLAQVVIPRESYCVSEGSLLSISSLNVLISLAIPTIALLGFISLISLFVVNAKKVKSIAYISIPILSQLPYILTEYSLSRYGLAQLSFSPILLMLVWSIWIQYERSRVGT